MNDRRAAFRLRVSTPDQLTESQAPALERLAENCGFDVVRHYEIRGSGAYEGAHLADVEDALADTNAGVYNIFVVWALDTLRRGGMKS